MKDRGVPQKLTKAAQPAAKRGGLPSASEGVIRQMESSAQNGESAGAEDEAVRHPPGSQRKNIPGGVGDLVAPPTFHVP
jgi:hypothetical protein